MLFIPKINKFVSMPCFGWFYRYPFAMSACNSHTSTRAVEVNLGDPKHPILNMTDQPS